MKNKFRPGREHWKWRPVGTEIVDRDGYLRRKVTDTAGARQSAKWRLVHVLVWEAANGPVPAGHVLWFRNGDKRDVRLENLELIPRAEILLRNHVNNLPPALAEVVHLKGALVRAIDRRSRA